MMTKTIEKALSWFESVKRGEENITILKSGAPEALHDSVMKAHGDRLPDNWIYDKYESILDAFGQYDIEDAEQLEDNRAEIVDGLVDVYTSDLTEWLNSNNSNVYYLTEALEDLDGKDGFRALMMAQYKAIDEIFSEVAGYLAAEEEKAGEEE